MADWDDEAANEFLDNPNTDPSVAKSKPSTKADGSAWKGSEGVAETVDGVDAAELGRQAAEAMVRYQGEPDDKGDGGDKAAVLLVGAAAVGVGVYAANETPEGRAAVSMAKTGAGIGMEYGKAGAEYLAGTKEGQMAIAGAKFAVGEAQEAWGDAQAAASPYVDAGTAGANKGLDIAGKQVDKGLGAAGRKLDQTGKEISLAKSKATEDFDEAADEFSQDVHQTQSDAKVARGGARQGGTIAKDEADDEFDDAADEFSQGVGTVQSGLREGGRQVRIAAEAAGREMDEAGRAAGVGMKRTAHALSTAQEKIEDAADQVEEMVVDSLNELLQSSALSHLNMTMEWDALADSYHVGADIIKAQYDKARGISWWDFDFVKFDIFRDFFQIVSLFFGALTWPPSFIVVWGFLTNIIAIQFEWIQWDIVLPDIPVLHVPNVNLVPMIIFVIEMILSIALFYVFRGKKRDDPDEIRDGEEVVRWEERSKKQLLLTQGIVTVMISMYMPLSRQSIEIVICHPNFFDPPACWVTAWHWIWLVMAILTLAHATIWLPIVVYKLIQKNKPKPKFFDEEGKDKQGGYTEEDYKVDLQRDKCPYLFLYKGYERKWAFYKVVLMAIKLSLIFPVIVIPHLYSWFGLGFGADHWSMAVLANVILLVFTVISFKASPFLKNEDDHIDQSARVTTNITAVVGYIPFSMTIKGIILNIVHWTNIFLMIAITILALKPIHNAWKKIRGRVDWSKKEMDFDIDRERKRRISHPFWEGLLANEEELKPAWERLIELQDIAAKIGASEYKQGLQPVAKEVRSMRMWVQQYLEGIDVFWDGPKDKPADLGPGFSAKSQTWFGKMYIVPFPFHVVIIYDDTGDYYFIKDEEEFMRFCQQNRSPEIERRRFIRRQIRCLDKQRVYFFHESQKTVKGGKKVDLTFEWGELHVTQSRPGREWSHGFNVSIAFKDGHGTGIVGERTTIGHTELGIEDDYRSTPQLMRLLSHQENRILVRRLTPDLLQKYATYRRTLFDSRMKKANALGYSFWYCVYNNPKIPRKALIGFLDKNESGNELVRDIPFTHELGLDFLYSRLEFFNSHPVVSQWFCFWDDFWELNKDLAFVRKNRELLDTKRPSAIIYRPMTQDELIKLLIEKGIMNKRENWIKGKIMGHPKLRRKYVNLLYKRMEELTPKGKKTTKQDTKHEMLATQLAETSEKVDLNADVAAAHATAKAAPVMMDGEDDAEHEFD